MFRMQTENCVCQILERVPSTAYLFILFWFFKVNFLPFVNIMLYNYEGIENKYLYFVPVNVLNWQLVDVAFVVLLLLLLRFY